MQSRKNFGIITLSLLFLFCISDINAQNLGIGTTNPRVKLHLVSGVNEGTMGFPYETLVVEKNEDSKLGIYSTAPNPVNYMASSIALGYTNYLDANGNYPSYEMQYGIWTNTGFILRFNALSRNANGVYIVNKSYSNILCLDTKGNVGINLTQGQAIAPISPTANLHVNGTVRFQNLSTATTGGNYLVVDASGNVKVSANSTANRQITSSVSTNVDTEIALLKQEIDILKEKILMLEETIKKVK